MIKSKAVDVEIFPNLFSVTFVDLQSYLKTFNDCGTKALTECLSVKEIKERLEKVESDIFYISDTDDSQLMELVAYFNKMQPHYENNVAIRYDLYGFNNQGYDDLMIKAFLMRFNHYDSVKLLIKSLYDLSKKIIALQSDKDALYNDKEIEFIKSYQLPYVTVDLQKIYALNSAGVNIDKDSGERIKFAKSLKQTSINLKWHELLDFVLPPIDEEEKSLYWNTLDSYRGMPLEELNLLITNDFDRYVLPKYVDGMLHYNKNDVFLCCEIVRQKPDEVRLRYSLSSAFKLNLLCCSRANIADKLLVKYYSQYSGLQPREFIKARTERTKLSFKKIIFPHIKFKTEQLQDLLEDMKKVVIYRTNKDSFSREFTFYGTTYTLATGGIHTKDRPGIYKSDDKYIYRHHDYTSYYPSIVISFGLCPKHLVQSIFVKMVAFFKDTRVKCKHTDDSIELVIEGVPNGLSAEALKIVINAIYGKFGSDLFFLYDRFVQMQVTINGQLMTMTLVEEFELNGIHVISANTDGLIIKLPRDKENIYKEITDRWNEYNKMGADSEDYKLFVTRDVNNYFNIQYSKKGDKLEFKGALDPKQYIKDLKKGYDMPVVAKAVYEYFANNIPVMETLRNHTDILDFCKTQNIGRQFDVVCQKVENNKVVTIESQRHVRFYVSTKGIIIKKRDKRTQALSSLASGQKVIILNSLDDKDIELRNIDYKYYYEEAYKIIDPIKLGISSSTKANNVAGTKSGKALLKKYARQYNTLFDLDDFN